ncbi:PIN-like domain-containing protein [Actinokineospora globicatena]|uniref:PIN-like domain-containing protein n=1 Tax=Actinokineospora globicatena TaxID=103729 RepID=UPI0020A3D4E5|nr:PIN domain-containing protein [Actinokineospora globicatena]MCP2305783.1 hypothetical protein [Actinokineospora globicatena]GLW80362.1 hypothetical protein Aglo01_48430 [Actinokineospora globicatena]GLW87190.1 hypothetical protein Aglo02_48290 [Actinokineospora globicatena]
MGTDGTSPHRGVFDGFEEYRTPRTGDYQQALTEGLVVLDANVLLNLYRYNKSARDDLLSVMGRIGDRLWVPHQAMREFWRNRESTLGALRGAANEAVTALEKAHRSSESAISAWTKKAALPDRLRDDLNSRLESAYAEVRQAIEAQADIDASAHTYDTNEDHVLSRLATVLKRRVGHPLTVEDHAKAVVEAEDRIKHQRPPGYLDKDKEPDLRIGDYLVWEQLLREAETRTLDTLFITSDTKDDWWTRSRDHLRGPRRELATEFHERTGCRLYMLQPQDLLDHASSLDVQIEPGSAEEVARVSQSREPSPPPRMEMSQATGMVDIGDGEMAVSPADYFQGMEDRVRAAVAILQAVCGPGWMIEPRSLRANPLGCRVTNGRVKRDVFWGPFAQINSLLFRAANSTHFTPALGAHPILAVVLDDNDVLSDDIRLGLVRTAGEFNVELHFLNGSFTLIPGAREV